MILNIFEDFICLTPVRFSHTGLGSIVCLFGPEMDCVRFSLKETRHFCKDSCSTAKHRWLQQEGVGNVQVLRYQVYLGCEVFQDCLF